MYSRCVDKFIQIREYVNDLVGDEEVACLFIKYDMYSAIYSCFNAKDNEEGQIELKKYMEKVIQSLINKFGLTKIYDEDSWLNFWNNTDEYNDFIKMYNLPYDMRIADMGIQWLRILDKLDDYKIEDKVSGVNKLLDYVIWSNSFYEIYAYQYWDNNSGNVRFEKSRVSELNYYGYKELKTYIDKISQFTLEEQIDKLNRQYLVTEFDYIYPDRETLWLDMIKKGISIPEAMKMTKHIARGKGLETYMKKKMYDAGYRDGIIMSMDNCMYLKSRSLAVEKLLYTINLIKGGEL